MNRRSPPLVGPLLGLLLSIAAAGACSSAESPHPSSIDPGGDGYDIVILGGRVVDGAGNPWFMGDMAIEGDRIARITPAGLLDDAPAQRRIDAEGLVVAPGFIDIQSHSRDEFLDGDGRVVSKATQGITTEIMGEGWTNAPANANTRAGSGTSDPSEDSPAHDLSGPHGFDTWLRAMEEDGTSPNIGSFVGATTIRVYAKGQAQGRATPAELDTMRAAVRRAMEDGAFGLATALIYPPGSFADTDELVELAEAMAPYGGLYITHMRSEADDLLKAIDEAIEIGRRAGVPVEIYHLKAAGKRNWDKVGAAIARIDGAREAGVDVQANMYPYVAGGTGIAAVLPPWASAGGKLKENLRDATMRERIVGAVLADTGDWENLGALSTPEGILVLGLEQPENRDWRGMRLAAIAGEMGSGWVDAAIDLFLSEEDGVGAIYFLMSEENVARQMRQPWIKFGTDAGGYDPDSAQELAHPRAYGTYPRILGRYVREQGVLRLEEAIRKMTSAVATRLSLDERGVLKEGMYADVVVFDPETIRDRATFADPHQLSVGVRHVLVNGVPVIADGRHTGATPGRVLRGPGYRLRPSSNEN